MSNYFISKLFPLFVVPLGLAFLFLLIGNIFNQNKFIKIAIIIIYFFSLSFVSDLIYKFSVAPYKRLDESSAKNAGAIVVLSGGNVASIEGLPNKVDWRDPDRFFAGIELLKNKKAPIIVFTGAINPYGLKRESEGEIYKKQAIKIGLNPNNILVTSKVLNTKDEAKAIKKLLFKDNLDNDILLVTSALHMKRAKKIFESNGFIVYPFPVDFRNISNYNIQNLKNPYNFFPNARSLKSNTDVLRELIGRIIYQSL